MTSNLEIHRNLIMVISTTDEIDIDGLDSHR